MNIGTDVLQMGSAFTLALHLYDKGYDETLATAL